VTQNVPKLRTFYAALLGTAGVGDDAYVEFAVPAGWTLALCEAGSIEFAAPGAHVTGTNRSVRIELEVDDADAEFERMAATAPEVVVPPTTWPWGTRAAWLRDPDGNLVSLYSRVEPTSIDDGVE
jgi:predicted enzyme related to lactoylglutathione lyase